MSVHELYQCDFLPAFLQEDLPALDQVVWAKSKWKSGHTPLDFIKIAPLKHKKDPGKILHGLGIRYPCNGKHNGISSLCIHKDNSSIIGWAP
jgi:hypothetical protein